MAGGALSTPAAAAAADDIPLGVASYSLREFSRAHAIRILKKLDVTNVNIKEFHLPYRSTPAELAKGRSDFEKAGLKILGGGTIYMQKNDEADVKFYFDYAKACGMPLMVVGPSAESVGLIEKYAIQYDIKVALHNHGPEDKHIPTPESALKLIRNMDPRMGLCIDIGHTTRTGTDVVEAIAAAGPRLLDMHVKDLRNLMDKDSQCPIGDGKMPIVAIFKQLKKMNYKGAVMMEYEIDGDNPMAGMQKSLAYMRGVLAGLRG
jgi:sugar phosphate isomerase/epimerase